MTKFEYLTLPLRYMGFTDAVEVDHVTIKDNLNVVGSNGWELVTVSHGMFIFKREVKG